MQSRVQQLALVLALVAAAGLLVPTGAIAFLPEQPTDQIDEQVAIQPTDSGYAYLEDDELVIDLSSSNPNIEAGGLNPDSEFTFDDLFVLHYDGDQYAEVWLSNESEGITFSVDGESIENRSNNVSLGPDESVTVGMTVNTSDPKEIESIDEFTVHTRVAKPRGANTASVSVQTAPSATVTVTTPAPGERVVSIEDASAGESVTADLESLLLDDTDDGTLTADTMTVDHERSGDSEFELSTVNETETEAVGDDFTAETGMKALGAVSVTPIEDDAVEKVGLDVNAPSGYLAARNVSGDDVIVYQYDGETWHALDAQHTSTDDGSEFAVAVEDPSTIVLGTPTPIFDVTTVQSNENEVTAGDTVSVVGTITNRGAANGTTTVPLTVDDETVAQQNVTLAPNETTNVTFTHQFQETGNHTVSIGDGPGVQVAVAAAADVTAASEVTETPTTQPTTQTVEATDEPATTTLVEEPAGIDLERIFGLGLVATLALLTVLLVRRRPLE
jgi:hypothetical protein